MVAKVLWSVLASTGSTWATIGSLQNALLKKGIRLSLEDLKKEQKLFFHEDYVTLKRINKEEDDIAINALRLLFMPKLEKQITPAISNEEINRLIEKFENEENKGFKLHFHQKDAVRMVVRNYFSIVTGGPGTGKTTVLSCITYVLRHIDKKTRIVFTAPTGKAARRISESTGEYANTTHKEFGITPENDTTFEFEGDVLFIDEISMLDNETLSKVLKACQTGKRVVLVGDIQQLPSVGIGACLRDLIRSKCIPTTMLTHTFRQDNSSKLFSNIENIKKGSAEIIEGEDYHAYQIDDHMEYKEAENEAFKYIRTIYRQEVEKYGVENVVVLLPYKVKGLCSNRVTVRLQSIANRKDSSEKCIKRTNSDNLDIFFTKDDYVMQLENRTECANGEIGKIIEVKPDGLIVEYGTTQVEYSISELDQIMLAYSMTIHKSQGSEYKSVIMALLNEHEAMLKRNLLYTGITRAKKECHLIYQQKAYETSVKTIADADRLTMLQKKLMKIRDQYKLVYGI